MLFLYMVGGVKMNFKCKCGEVVTVFDVFYEENGKFKAYYYQCPVCGVVRSQNPLCRRKDKNYKGV